MSAEVESRMSARFLGRPRERFLTVKFDPPAAAKANILYLPPFGEEMNRCRSLAAQQARGFAEAGYACTLLDFFGTGDSDGELYEASIDIWHQNIHLALETLNTVSDLPIILWGCRLGGLIALDFASRSETEIKDIILWQPVTSGKRYVTQILRQRVAALTDQGLPGETTQEIRERLESGERVEISGYTLGGKLLADIESVDLLAAGRCCSNNIYWLENITELSQEVSPGSSKLIDKLREQGNTIEVKLFSDPPIWQLHKRDEAPELISIMKELVL